MRYDITERLRRKNELPIVVIEGKELTLKAKKTNFLIIMKQIKDIQKLSDDEKSDITDITKKLDEVVRYAFGDDGLEYINSLNYTIMALISLMIDVVAMCLGGELAEDEDSEKK